MRLAEEDIIMGNEFLKTWFSGISEAMDNMNAAERDVMMAPCAKACSDSYPAQVFMRAAAEASEMRQFLQIIEEKMQGVVIEKNGDGTLVFVYPQCYCELHTDGYIDNPRLCNCSRLNLTYNFEAAFGPDCAEVKLLQSVLGGAETCRLEVRFLRDVTFPD